MIYFIKSIDETSFFIKYSLNLFGIENFILPLNSTLKLTIFYVY